MTHLSPLWFEEMKTKFVSKGVGLSPYLTIIIIHYYVVQDTVSQTSRC